MKPGLRMVAGLARVRRLDAKVRRLVRSAYASAYAEREEYGVPSERAAGRFRSLSDVTHYFTRMAQDGAFERWERGPDHFGVMGYTPMRAPKDFS